MRLSESALGLLLALALPAAGQTLAWKDLGGGRLQLLDRGQPALVYNYGPQLKQGAPEEKRRCCYIFPVYTPAGVSMLDDFPPDHWHHRGLFWAWPVVETNGRKYDLWKDFTAKHRADKAPTATVANNQARLEARNYWVADGKDIVREDVLVTVLPPAGASRTLRLELAWEALSGPVTLRGSEESGKSYGGVGARFAAREGTTIRADGATLAKDEDLIPHQWAELEGVYGGKRAVLRIASDPKNPGAPYQWCLRDYGFIGPSFPGRTAAVDGYTLQPGRPLKVAFTVEVRDVK